MSHEPTAEGCDGGLVMKQVGGHGSSEVAPLSKRMGSPLEVKMTPLEVWIFDWESECAPFDGPEVPWEQWMVVAGTRSPPWILWFLSPARFF